MSTENNKNSVLAKIFQNSSMFTPHEMHPSERMRAIATFWSILFFENFVNCPDDAQQGRHADDQVYFVLATSPKENSKSPTANNNNLHSSSSSSSPNFPHRGNEKEKYLVRRKADHKGMPSPDDISINWEETFFLNMIQHDLEFLVEVTIRKLDGPAAPDSRPKATVLKRVSKKLFANPNKTNFSIDWNKKSDKIIVTYPSIHFACDDFETAWKDIVLGPGELVAVELIAVIKKSISSYGIQSDWTPPESAESPKSPTNSRNQVRVFAGALAFENLIQVYKNNKPFFGHKNLREFELIGPQGKGRASMAIGDLNAPDKTPQLGLKTLNPMNWIPSPSSSSSSTHLNCLLVDVNLHWDSIMKDILIHQSKQQ